MKLSTRLFISILALFFVATATPHDKRQEDTPQPWLLRNLGTSQPSGRPRNYPWSTIIATISDPNEALVGYDEEGQEVRIPANNTGLNCRAIWIEDDGPYGRRWPCDNTDDIEYGYWQMEVIEVPGGNTLYSFDLKFTFQAWRVIGSRPYRKRFEGTAQMRGRPEGNMTVSCAASGSCGGYLLPEARPFPVNQMEV